MSTREDKNLRGDSVFVELNDGEELRRNLSDKIALGKECQSITRSPLCMSYSHC